jgi:hypothetical protein
MRYELQRRNTTKHILILSSCHCLFFSHIRFPADAITRMHAGYTLCSKDVQVQASSQLWSCQSVRTFTISTSDFRSYSKLLLLYLKSILNVIHKFNVRGGSQPKTQTSPQSKMQAKLQAKSQTNTQELMERIQQGTQQEPGCGTYMAMTTPSLGLRGNC